MVVDSLVILFVLIVVRLVVEKVFRFCEGRVVIWCEFS